MAAVDKEAGMIDFQERLVELLRSDDEGYDDLPPQGQAKVFRPAGCWVYRVDLGEEEEFHRWLVDSFFSGGAMQNGSQRRVPHAARRQFA